MRDAPIPLGINLGLRERCCGQQQHLALENYFFSPDADDLGMREGRRELTERKRELDRRLGIRYGSEIYTRR